ncbi:hypothetical protein THASP1DRAFT_27474 [Thamnocephalis sphaerospora]|uniref:Uncharacterized protein n=1 Tax=Thamnocephalis sphaerospora TaxID=78915 RepID=A0A4P9XWQ5_9FUNG|nr:hypothetical protein THASP1DRAFT_27474 [Thamnocephalis sphaerospora]|eukprot:RKP10768.1 hypothetical protein THASP1DRAFT_27474 [Thamnocephalis sphaerospora]
MPEDASVATDIAKLSHALRVRLRLATLKAERGWESFSLHEAERLLAAEQQSAPVPGVEQLVRPRSLSPLDRRARHSLTPPPRPLMWAHAAMNAASAPSLPSASAIWMMRAASADSPSASSVSMSAAQAYATSLINAGRPHRPGRRVSGSHAHLPAIQSLSSANRRKRVEKRRPEPRIRRAGSPTSARHSTSDNSAHLMLVRGRRPVGRHTGEAAIHTAVAAAATATRTDANAYLSPESSREYTEADVSASFWSSTDASARHTDTAPGRPRRRSGLQLMQMGPSMLPSPTDTTPPASPTTEQAARLMMLLSSPDAHPSRPT